jgi:hypothetical protein
MTTKYAADAADALEMIAEAGATVTFPGAVPGTPGVYDPLTGTWSGGTGATDATGSAVQIEDDPERFQSIGLVLVNPITLLIAAKNLAITPAPGMLFLWASRMYMVKDVEAVDPAGDGAVLYTVIGSA